MKLESHKARHPQLLYESKLYRILQGGVGIPHIKWVSMSYEVDVRGWIYVLYFVLWYGMTQLPLHRNSGMGITLVVTLSYFQCCGFNIRGCVQCIVGCRVLWVNTNLHLFSYMDDVFLVALVTKIIIILPVHGNVLYFDWSSVYCGLIVCYHCGTHFCTH